MSSTTHVVHIVQPRTANELRGSLRERRSSETETSAAALRRRDPTERLGAQSNSIGGVSTCRPAH